MASRLTGGDEPGIMTRAAPMQSILNVTLATKQCSSRATAHLGPAGANGSAVSFMGSSTVVDVSRPHLLSVRRKQYIAQMLCDKTTQGS